MLNTFLKVKSIFFHEWNMGDEVAQSKNNILGYHCWVDTQKSQGFCSMMMQSWQWAESKSKHNLVTILKGTGKCVWNLVSKSLSSFLPAIDKSDLIPLMLTTKVLLVSNNFHCMSKKKQLLTYLLATGNFHNDDETIYI